MASRVRRYKQEPEVGKNYPPTYDARDELEEGSRLATAAVSAANVVVQSRASFPQKYPYGYDKRGIKTHKEEVENAQANVVTAHGSREDVDARMDSWRRQRQKRDEEEERGRQRATRR